MHLVAVGEREHASHPIRGGGGPLLAILPAESCGTEALAWRHAGSIVDARRGAQRVALDHLVARHETRKVPRAIPALEAGLLLPRRQVVLVIAANCAGGSALEGCQPVDGAVQDVGQGAVLPRLATLTCSSISTDTPARLNTYFSVVAGRLTHWVARVLLIPRKSGRLLKPACLALQQPVLLLQLLVASRTLQQQPLQDCLHNDILPLDVGPARVQDDGAARGALSARWTQTSVHINTGAAVVALIAALGKAGVCVALDPLARLAPDVQRLDEGRGKAVTLPARS